MEETRGEKECNVEIKKQKNARRKGKGKGVPSLRPATQWSNSEKWVLRMRARARKCVDRVC